MNNLDEKTRAKLKKARSSCWNFFIKRRPIAWLALIGIIISGLISYNSLPREIQPEVNIPFVVVSTGLPGASPEDTETLISIPLEKQLSSLSDVKTLGSTSGFSFSSVFLEFEAEVDMAEALNDVKDAVDIAKVDFPEDATEPVVVKAEPNAFSIITFSIIGDKPLNEVSQIASDIKEELETIKDVKVAEISGQLEKFIEIKIDQEKAEGYGLDLQTISNLISFSNSNLPVGIITTDKINYSVRIDNRFNSIEDIRNLPLISFSNQDNFTPLLLRDIATVEETYPSQNIISKLSVQGANSTPAVSLQLFKREGSNISTVVNSAKEKVEELKQDGTIPSDVEIFITNDNSLYIEEELGTLTSSGIFTTIVIIAILFLALGFKQGLISGLSIPVIFLIAFTGLSIQGMSLNTLSLFSLVIALGLMVDTTIVVMEGIFENIKKGLTPQDAALLSVYTYKWPLIAGTMTTIFAFFPMLLVSGILGEFLATLPLTISAALFASLFISLTIAPSIAAKFVKAKKEGSHQSLLEPFFDKIGLKFRKVTKWAIKRRLIRMFVIITAIVCFGLSMTFPASGALKTEMFPRTDQNYFVVQIETPKGTAIDETEKIVEDIEQVLYSKTYVESFLSKIGTSQSIGLTDDPFFAGGTSDSNLANITVNLIDKEERFEKSFDIADKLRTELSSYRKAKITLQEIDEGPPSDSAVSLQLSGKEIPVLQEISQQIIEIIESIPGTTNASSSLKPGLNEFNYTLDKDVLTYHGLSSLQVSAFIRNIVQGINSSDITLEGEELEIYVKYDLYETDQGRSKLSITDIENLKIATPKGYSIPLSELGEFHFTQSLSSIAREDQKRNVTISSDTTKDANAIEITEILTERLEELDLPTGYEVDFGGEFEEIEESFNELFGKAMPVGLIMIAFTLVLMFNSFKQSFIIIITLPLALIGVFPGLYLIGLELSFPAFLGIVALTGIVVNDAIVLIDRINVRRSEGMEFAEAISEAANARLQPIIMTSITTIVGILPLALTNEFWTGLGFSLIFGLMASTILTLVVVPVLYYSLESANLQRLLAIFLMLLVAILAVLLPLLLGTSISARQLIAIIIIAVTVEALLAFWLKQIANKDIVGA